MNRRGQGLSVNVIILIAIGLLVLIIAIILINRSGKSISDNATNACVTQGGSCSTSPCTTGNIDLGLGSSKPLCPTTNNIPQWCCRYDFGSAATT